MLMKATKGKGVDVILNSLSGDLLDESWRCIADGGTMIEIGKTRHARAKQPGYGAVHSQCFLSSDRHIT